MSFEKIVPEWNAQGTEPPSELKNEGFTIGYKPPADYFNWFWYNVSQCLSELQENAVANDDVISIEKGGTGKTNTEDATKALLYKGTNQAPADDLPSSYPQGMAIFYESANSQLPYKPYNYGYLFHFRTNSDVAQLWFDLANGKVYKRTGNATGWNASETVDEKRGWEAFYTSKNKPTLADLGAAAASHATRHYKDGADPISPSAIGATPNYLGDVDGTNYTFNTALQQGEYSVTCTSGTIDGQPSITAPYYGKLITYVNNGKTHNNTNNWAWQVYYSTVSNYVAYRNKVNNASWSSWQRFYTQGFKPSAADIGAAKIYTNVTELGLSEATVTMLGIANAMIDGSIGLFSVGSTWNASEVPTSYGTLFIAKRASSRALFIFRETGGQNTTWTGSINTHEGVSFSGWLQLFDSRGGELSGDTLIKHSSNPAYKLKNTYFGREVSFRNNNNGSASILNSTGSGNDYTELIIDQESLGAGVLKLKICQNGTEHTYNLYGEHNKPTAGGIPVVTTTGSSNAYVATVDGLEALTDGYKLTIIPNFDASSVYCTLNVNNLGAKSIFRRRLDNSQLYYQGPVAWLKNGVPVTLTYSTNLSVWLADATDAGEHDHAANDISAGTLGGEVKANAHSITNIGNAQVRNIYAGTSDLTAGSSTLATGDIYLVYE